MNKYFTFMRESSTARFFIPAGIMLIIFGIVMFTINIKNQDYKKVEATVTNVEVLTESYTDVDGEYVEATYNVSLQYTVGTKGYESSLDGVGKYEVGDKITIYYDEKNPNNITQTKSLLMPIIITTAGTVSLVFGICSASSALKRNKKMKDDEKEWKDGK